MTERKLRYTCVLTTVTMMHLYKDPCSLAYYLAKSGAWESTVAYFGPQEVHHEDFEKHVRLVYLGSEKVYKKRYRLAKKYLQEHATEIDVIMVFNYGTVSYGMARTVKKYNPKAIAYCKLDMRDDGFEHFNARTPWRKLMSIGEIVKSRPIDLFTVESKSFYRELLKQPVFRNRLEYLPNGVSEVGVDISALDMVRKEKVVLTIGRLGAHQKNNELLLEAIKVLHEQAPAVLEDWRFILAGPAETAFLDKVAQFKQELPELADRLVLTGNLDTREEMYGLCAKASIICMTSRWESFGIATVEGMYFGCCPVITDYGGVAHDQVPDDVPWGAVVSQDSASLAFGLQKFMSYNELNELSRQVRDFARENFNYNILAHTLHEYLMNRL